jgi:hypothetical protein
MSPSRLFDQQRSDALSDLASQSVFQGQTLQSNMMANILAGRGQQLGEIATEYDVAQRRRALGIGEQQQQVALDREARDRQIAEAIRMRQQPLSELSALMTGTTPFTQVAAQGPMPVAPVSGPAPVDLGALAAAGQADALGAFQGGVAQRAAWLEPLAALGGGYLSRPRQP